ncbi:MAG TPA: hypothetical protein VGK73_21855, partial [Polyangiaceae bacterium]
MTRSLFSSVALICLALSAPAAAETKLSVSGRVVRVSDLDPNAPAELAGIEVCKAPPPGSSRLIARTEIQERVRDAGGDPKALKLPPSLRIEAAAERWNAVDVAAQADSTVRAALPPGVTLVKLTA